MGSTRLRGWRKIATATWSRPSDPQIYGDLEIDATQMLAYMEQARAASGVKVSVTHLVGKALAHALAANPDVNQRFTRGRTIPRESVDVFYVVSTDDGRELTGVKIEHADAKSVVAIAEELSARTSRIRAGDDPDLGKTKSLLDRLPPRVLRVLMSVVAWLTVDLNLDLRRFGLPRQGFGGAMVTSVGMFGVEKAYAPLAHYYRVPFLVLVGEVTERPVAVDGEVVIQPRLTLGATMDHRMMDGAHAGKLARSVREYCADPARFEPA